MTQHIIEKSVSFIRRSFNTIEIRLIIPLQVI